MHSGLTKYFPVHFLQEALKMPKLAVSIRQILKSVLGVNKYKTEAQNEQAKLKPPSSENSSIDQNREKWTQGLLAQPEEQNSVFLEEAHTTSLHSVTNQITTGN